MFRGFLNAGRLPHNLMSHDRPVASDVKVSIVSAYPEDIGIPESRELSTVLNAHKCLTYVDKKESGRSRPTEDRLAGVKAGPRVRIPHPPLHEWSVPVNATVWDACKVRHVAVERGQVIDGEGRK